MFTKSPSALEAERCCSIEREVNNFLERVALVASRERGVGG